MLVPAELLEHLETLKADYARFPKDQTFDLYAEDVYFKDPLNEFRGRDRYKETIAFIDRWFQNPDLELHEIRFLDEAESPIPHRLTIRSDWTLRWNSPLPWLPRIAIPGWSELTFNEDGLIASHVDYWKCSQWEVVQQHFPWTPSRA